jgi:hypothetical protein
MWRAILRVLPALLCSTSVALGAEGGSPEAPAGSATTRPDRAWNLSVGTGAGGFFEFTGSPLGNGVYDESYRRYRFQANVRVDRELGRRLRLGVAYVYYHWTEAYLVRGNVAGTIDNEASALMADATLRWVRTDHLEVYSAVAAGAGRLQRDGTGIGASSDGVTSGFAFQLRLVGLSAGTERVRLFADLGLGFEGLLVGGVLVRL